MIATELRISLFIIIICYFIIILMLLKNKALELKYTLLWLAAGFSMAIVLVFPDTLQFFLKIIGIGTYMNGIYVVCIGFIIAILMALTSIVSRQMLKVQNLTQECAMLEHRIRELENSHFAESTSASNTHETGLNNDEKSFPNTNDI